MATQYDLVILGATAAGRAAASFAAARGARVALIEQGLGLAAAPFYTAALRDRAQQQPGSGLVGFQAAVAQAEAAIAALEAQQSPLALGDRGVDYIAEFGLWALGPGLTWVTPQRTLTGRAGLLTPAWQTRPPDSPGLGAADYWRPEQLWAQPDRLPPTGRLAILGATILAVELAQSCQRLGWEVTLVAPQVLLPALDRTVVTLLQAHLEAAGVTVLTHSAVTQVRALGGQTWLQAGDRALEVEAVVLAAGLQPDYQDWNLAGRVAIAPEGRLRVNRWLQTSQPSLFACQRSTPAIATAEALVAARQALGDSRQPLSYRSWPIAIATTPPMAAVGLPETAAPRYGHESVLAVTVPSDQASGALLQNLPTGCCKLIARRSGELLGAHALGPGAEDWISAIALAMEQDLRVADLAQLTVVQPSGSELIPRIAQAWLARAGSPDAPGHKKRAVARSSPPAR